jgi:signal transduction histidine kinase
MRSEKKNTTRIRDQEKEQVQPPETPEPVQEEDPKTREFLFKTFHDLRNPLHTIMGYTSLVLRKTRDQIPEKQQENLEKVLQSAEKLNEIVDRMVAFYRKK